MVHSPYAPVYQIAWRLLWFVPLQTSRLLFVLFVLIGWGPATAARCLRQTV